MIKKRIEANPVAYFRLTTSIFLLFWCCFPLKGFAQSSNSASYRIDESAFGIGGEVDTSSGSYRANGFVGQLGEGNGRSATYNAVPGFITPNEEFLELNVTAATVNLGTLDDATTGTGTGSFYVRTYINGSYVVTTTSQTLTSEGGATITAMSSAGTSSPGTEQFGINLVANTLPVAQGNNPDNQPSATFFSNNYFAGGEAAPGYASANNYKYVPGEIIARSVSGNLAWGRTNYTISYLANVSATTEAGTYSMVHDIVLSATY
jgi:hypothetical protein